jgi:hypothetical protein
MAGYYGGLKPFTGQEFNFWNMKTGGTMIAWTSDELNRIGNAEELKIAGQRADGRLCRIVIVWVVRLGDDLYVRCVNGRKGAWFCGALIRHAGRIWAGGVEKDVTFVEEVDPEVNAKIDEAYLTKYERYPQYVAPMVTPKVCAATLKLVPR